MVLSRVLSVRLRFASYEALYVGDFGRWGVPTMVLLRSPIKFVGDNLLGL